MFHILKKGEENMVIRRETENIRDPKQNSRDKNKPKNTYRVQTTADQRMAREHELKDIAIEAIQNKAQREETHKQTKQHQ